MTEQTVTLQPGESKPVSFEAIPHEAKLYHVSVDGLTGSFMAVALPFTFSNFVARKIVCPGATAWYAVEISCLITNPNSVAVTQDVAIMWARKSRTYHKWITCQGSFGEYTRIDCICDPIKMCLDNPFSLTLQPGESYNFFYQGHCMNSCAPILPRNYNWYFWLEDGTGNKSAERSFST